MRTFGEHGAPEGHEQKGTRAIMKHTRNISRTPGAAQTQLQVILDFLNDLATTFVFTFLNSFNEITSIVFNKQGGAVPFD